MYTSRLMLKISKPVKKLVFCAQSGYKLRSHHHIDNHQSAIERHGTKDTTESKHGFSLTVRISLNSLPLIIVPPSSSLKIIKTASRWRFQTQNKSTWYPCATMKKSGQIHLLGQIRKFSKRTFNWPLVVNRTKSFGQENKLI